jgi:hypothetical protein
MHTTDSKPLVRALYDDDDVVLGAVKELRAQGVAVKEVYSPFPIHGLDKAMGLKETRIAMAAFMYGLLGLATIVTITYYQMIVDWPMNIGGKPNATWGWNMPAFVPVLFELTVFFTAHLMVWTFFVLNGLYPGRAPQNPDPRTTDDKFMIEVEDGDHVVDLLKKTGAIEITHA